MLTGSQLRQRAGCRRRLLTLARWLSPYGRSRAYPPSLHAWCISPPAASAHDPGGRPPALSFTRREMELVKRAASATDATCASLVSKLAALDSDVCGRLHGLEQHRNTLFAFKDEAHVRFARMEEDKAAVQQHLKVGLGERAARRWRGWGGARVAVGTGKQEWEPGGGSCRFVLCSMSVLVCFVRVVVGSCWEQGVGGRVVTGHTDDGLIFATAMLRWRTVPV